MKAPGVCEQMQPQVLPSALTVQWLISASGSYSRAARSLEADIQNSDLEDIQMCRVINDRIMTVRRGCSDCGSVIGLRSNSRVTNKDSLVEPDSDYLM